MFKINKLTKLVLMEFAGPFVMTFFISLFVLLMQFLWKYIDDLVGKGLDWWTIIRLLSYTATTLVPLALPLAILVSSIMTFGNLAERYEIVAVKSAGISLQRLTMPLLITAILISVGAFFFSNYVLPWSNLKAGSLLYDVRQQKPSFAIKEGVFYNGIDGYSLKIGAKADDGKSISQIMIYDHSSGQGNKKVIVADSGKMELSTDKNFLVLSLKNGISYEEQSKRRTSGDSRPHMRYAFNEQTIRFDLSSFKLNRTDEDLFKDNNQMMNIWQLQSSLDSLLLQRTGRIEQFKKDIKPYYNFTRDTTIFNLTASVAVANPLADSSVAYKRTVYEYALNQARAVKAYINGTDEELSSRMKQIVRYRIELHRKFTLSFACFVLFLIGAPLGSIIRKGGIGLPIVISIAFFLIYHIISITGEKMAREEQIPSWQGMWQSSFILLPVGIFLAYKATRDSALFDVDLYLSFFKKFMKKKK